MDNQSPPVVRSDKKLGVALVLSWYLGNFGIDRFYLGYTGLGLVKLFTLGGFGVWSLIDFIFLLTGDLNDSDGRRLSCSSSQANQPPSTDKTMVIALVLSVFLGFLGADRFYLGYTGLGMVKLLWSNLSIVGLVGGLIVGSDAGLVLVWVSTIAVLGFSIFNLVDVIRIANCRLVTNQGEHLQHP